MDDPIDRALRALADDVDTGFGLSNPVDRMIMVCLHCGLCGMLEHCPRCSVRASAAPTRWVYRVHARPIELAAFRIGGQEAVLALLLGDA